MAKHAKTGSTKLARRPASSMATSAEHLTVESQAPPAAPQPPAEAVSLFEKGMEALQRHDYRDASDAFHKVVSGFPGERALLDRARVYLNLCERERRRRAATPTTPEEHLTAATAALNNGDESSAERLVHAVLSEHPEQDLALYLSAAIHARRGRRDDALEQLRHVIELSPDAAAQAVLDPDFDSLHDIEAFQLLTDAAANAPRRRRESQH